MTVFSKTPLLDTIRTPDDLRRLKVDQIQQVADELRQETIDAVSVTGGHFGAGLGVVELTTAIHYIFDTPRDRLVWDVGHQAYPHKILTGRRDRIRTLRTGGGLSGFTKRTESDYDPFGAAHSSTSISAALGMAVARDLSGGKNNVIAVIGDGAMSAGMAYEAMNNAGAMNSRLIVILNDNDMSIAPPVGAMSAYLSRLVSSRPYTGIRNVVKRWARKMLPRALFKVAQRTESDYDPFGAAPSSPSISAGLGMAVARDLSGGKNNVISVIGDGAMSAGMAYEAMNNAGAMNSRLIVILNDNDMLIAPPVGVR